MRDASANQESTQTFAMEIYEHKDDGSFVGNCHILGEPVTLNYDVCGSVTRGSQLDFQLKLPTSEPRFHGEFNESMLEANGRVDGDVQGGSHFILQRTANYELSFKLLRRFADNVVSQHYGLVSSH